MKITNHNRSEVQGQISSTNFTIEASAKAFELLIARLYSDPISAFIRELGTNAYEAHQMLGKEKTPFLVTVPTYNKPVWTIRDYGPGLSKDEINHIYTVIFNSTKTDSNDLGGCFGLGSKSPYAYTNNYTVTSYKDGLKLVYTASRNEEGIPTLNLMYEGPSNEASGVEISVPIKPNDINAVITKTNNVYRWFLTTPNVVGHIITKPKIMKDYGTFKIVDENIGPSVRMGNIVYKITDTNIKLESFGRANILLEMPIGHVTPEPSREGIHYNGKTVALIETAIKLAKKKVIDELNLQIGKCNSWMEACNKTAKVIANTPFVNITDFSFNGKVLSHDIQLDKCKAYYYSSPNLNELKGRYYRKPTIPTQRNMCFIELDKRTANREKMKELIQTKGYDYCVTINTYDTNTNYTRQHLIDECHVSDSEIIKISDLTYNITRTSRGKQVGQVFKYNGNSFVTYAWDEVKDHSTIPKNAVYVKMNRFKAEFQGKEINLHDIITLIRHLKIDVYGVKDVKNVSSSWVKLEDYIKSKEQSLESQFKFVEASQSINSNLINNCEKIRKKITNPNLIGTIDGILSINRHYDRSLYAVISSIGIKPKQEDIKPTLQKLQNDYPILFDAWYNLSESSVKSLCSKYFI